MIPKLSTMTPEAKRVAIATACGWTDCNFYEDNAGPGFWNGYPPPVIGLDKSGEWECVKAQYHKPLPDYLSSLDACHEFEQTLTGEQRTEYYCTHLPEITGANTDDWMHKQLPLLVHATATQRADAFILTKQLATL